MQKWKLKNAIAHILAKIPCGENLYYFIQRNITKSVFLNDKTFRERFYSKVLQHLIAISKFCDRELSKSSIFEFGAGWDLLAPIGFSLIGGGGVVTVDLNEYVRPELIKNTLKLYAKNQKNILEACNGKNINVSEKFHNISDILNNFDDKNVVCFLKDNLGIEYRPKYNAASTDYSDETFAFIISNVTLEHIPRQSLKMIFDECHRILKADGLISVTADCKDHYSYYDKSISPYNYLKYSNKEWVKYNSSIHYQNRLRINDYRELMTESGFVCVEEIYSEPNDEDRNDFMKITPSEDFSKYSMHDLMIKFIHFIAKKQNQDKRKRD